MNSEPGGTVETRGRTPWAGLCFIAILFLALALRTVNLSTNPNGLQIDEASIAYDAYLVGQTGKDEKGNHFPLYPQSSWNPKHPVYFYPAVLSVRLLGLNRVGSRAPAVFFGTLAVFVVYFLAMELFGSIPIALLSSFLLAVSPWHVHFSRFGIEASSFPTTFILALLFLLRGVKRHPANLIPGAIFAGATFYSYPIALVFVPLFLIGFFLIYRARLLERAAWAAAAVFIIAAAFAPVAGCAFNRTGMTSYVRATSINGELFHAKVEAHLHARGDPVSLAIASSRVACSAYGFVTNYFGYVRPAFLFLRGDTVSILHNDGHHGMTLYGTYFFMLIGLFSFARRRGKSGLVILWWFLMFPVGASLMRWGEQHAIRTIIALPCVQIAAAAGIVETGCLIARALESPKALKAATALIVIAISANAFMHLRYYFVEYPKTSARAFNYGVDDVLEFAESRRSEVEAVILSSRIPYVYSYLFFHVPPTKRELTWDPVSGALDVDATARKLGYIICDVGNCLESVPSPALAIARPGQLPKGIYKKKNAPGYFSISPAKREDRPGPVPHFSIALISSSGPREEL